MTESNSRYIFNVGLVYTGTLVITWCFFLMESFAVLESHVVITHRVYDMIRWALVIAGVCLAMAGIVRFGIGLFFNIIHDVSATGMGVVLALLMLFLYRLIPGYNRIFYILSIVAFTPALNVHPGRCHTDHLEVASAVSALSLR